MSKKRPSRPDWGQLSEQLTLHVVQPVISAKCNILRDQKVGSHYFNSFLPCSSFWSRGGLSFSRRCSSWSIEVHHGVIKVTLEASRSPWRRRCHPRVIEVSLHGGVNADALLGVTLVGDSHPGMMEYHSGSHECSPRCQWCSSWDHGGSPCSCKGSFAFVDGSLWCHRC